MTEHDIVRGCRKNKRKYQRALYDKYASTLLGICYRYFPDEFAANDLLQEVFMQVFDKISTFKEQGSLEGWLKRITVNMAINEIKRQKRQLDQVPIDEQWEIGAPAQDDSADVLKMISELPDGYREIFNLHAIEGYKFKEIGDIMGLAEGNVRVRYHRARKRLGVLLNEHFLK